MEATGPHVDVPNFIDISRISASLFVAVLLAFLATPMVRYVTRGDGKHRSLRELTVGFFRLSPRSAAFRHAAVLSGVLFVVNDLLYEVAQKLAPGIAARASIAFWVYAALTVVLSVIALFAEPEPDAMGSHQEPVTPPLPASSQSGVSRLHRMWLVLIGILQVVRIVTALIVVAGIISIGIATGSPVWYSVRLAVAVAMAAMASFALNDYYDQERDIVNAPNRAIPSGKLTESQVLFAALLLFLGAISIGAHGLSGLALLVFLTGCIGGVAYNEFVRRWPAGKGLVTAFFSSLILVFDLLAFRLPVRFFLFSVACFLFVAGRELLMDIRDLEGDRRAGLRTLATYWSEARAAYFGFAVILASLVPLCVFLAIAGGGRGAWLALLFYLAIIGAAAVVWRRPGGRWVAIEIIKCCFIAGILVMVA
ncbi:MAG TPA: UbiA family prenyltransferase [Thermoanaerobaculia bacterium]|nr:UbiA family prenyltransferase [Thermoanaerobaculia bacterium]